MSDLEELSVSVSLKKYPDMDDAKMLSVAAMKAIKQLADRLISDAASILTVETLDGKQGFPERTYLFRILVARTSESRKDGIYAIDAAFRDGMQAAAWMMECTAERYAALDHYGPVQALAMRSEAKRIKSTAGGDLSALLIERRKRA